ncbi:hypothetical protein A3K64_03855 [Candidatus Micrarchaeota archaeon RBG_16_36_9]|nr:MAG: hypothetical protein A3K64_03855 [Candidatus Micrarchaeota archaeon RBG_16_36_9]
MEDVEDIYKMLGLIIVIAFIIALGLSLVSSSSYAALECTEFNESYITFEPYTKYEYQIVWGAFYQQILDKTNIPIPRNRPTFISYSLCSPCKYNVTFISDLPTDYFVFDKFNNDRYLTNQSAFPLNSDMDSIYRNLSFTIDDADKYYFVFDRSSQGRNLADPSTGRLIIYQLKGVNQSTQTTKYREVTKYRNVTRCSQI